MDSGSGARVTSMATATVPFEMFNLMVCVIQVATASIATATVPFEMFNLMMATATMHLEMFGQMRLLTGQSGSPQKTQLGETTASFLLAWRCKCPVRLALATHLPTLSSSLTTVLEPEARAALVALLVHSRTGRVGRHPSTRPLRPARAKLYDIAIWPNKCSWRDLKVSFGSAFSGGIWSKRHRTTGKQTKLCLRLHHLYSQQGGNAPRRSVSTPAPSGSKAPFGPACSSRHRSIYDPADSFSKLSLCLRSVSSAIAESLKQTSLTTPFRYFTRSPLSAADRSKRRGIGRKASVHDEDTEDRFSSSIVPRSSHFLRLPRCWRTIPTTSSVSSPLKGGIPGVHGCSPTGHSGHPRAHPFCGLDAAVIGTDTLQATHQTIVWRSNQEVATNIDPRPAQTLLFDNISSGTARQTTSSWDFLKAYQVCSRARQEALLYASDLREAVAALCNSWSASMHRISSSSSSLIIAEATISAHRVISSFSPRGLAGVKGGLFRISEHLRAADHVRQGSGVWGQISRFIRGSPRGPLVSVNSRVCAAPTGDRWRARRRESPRTGNLPLLGGS
ncbi:hypothetical protein KSP40_PGU017431 [Platanthera guangdongensis]|uniref:Uncharacterized protein n=1 Tax=Platanthera guangdongensis TaxID=2320717 RepID=A0ABR2LHS0_9ASPA